MKRWLVLLPLLVGCAPRLAAQPVQVWEGEARVLLREQRYRMTMTVDPVSHALSGTLHNLSSGDRFQATGTLLPVAEGGELTAQLHAGGGARVGVSVLGVNVSTPLKSDALLSGRVAGRVFSGQLRINGITSPLTLRRVQ